MDANPFIGPRSHISFSYKLFYSTSDLVFIICFNLICLYACAFRKYFEDDLRALDGCFQLFSMPREELNTDNDVCLPDVCL